MQDTSVMGKIFICYRRQDSEDIAGRLHEWLERRFGADNVFMDVDSLPLGEKFPDRIRAAISESDVLLALIGEQWLNARDPEGRRRLDDAEDYVRVEIEEALRQGVKTVPVLLHNTAMPSKKELPPTCIELATVNAPRVRPGSDFKHDAGLLLKALEAILDDRQRQRAAERERLAREQAETQRLAREQAERERRIALERCKQELLSAWPTTAPRKLLLAALALVAVALALYVFRPKPGGPATASDKPDVVVTTPPAPRPSHAPIPPVPPPEPPKLIANSLDMQMVLVPAGEFEMGDRETKEQLAEAGFYLYEGFDNADERPPHRVRITRPFYLGACEVTKGQFARFVKAAGYKTDAETDGKGGSGYNAETQSWETKPELNWRSVGFTQDDDHPVVNVSWNDAVEFCEWLGRQEGKTYRLPTEAEWEYACRAGTKTRFWTGDSQASLEGAGNFWDQSARRKFPKSEEKSFLAFDDGWPFTAPVGRFRANGFGLYDMHGNVWEWCQDWYDKDYYGVSPAIDPEGPASGSFRGYRGGGWCSYPVFCRSANRLWDAPAFRYGYLGFRVLSVPVLERKK